MADKGKHDITVDGLLAYFDARNAVRAMAISFALSEEEVALFEALGLKAPFLPDTGAKLESEPVTEVGAVLEGESNRESGHVPERKQTLVQEAESESEQVPVPRQAPRQALPKPAPQPALGLLALPMPAAKPVPELPDAAKPVLELPDASKPAPELQEASKPAPKPVPKLQAAPKPTSRPTLKQAPKTAPKPSQRPAPTFARAVDRKVAGIAIIVVALAALALSMCLRLGANPPAAVSDGPYESVGGSVQESVEQAGPSHAQAQIAPETVVYAYTIQDAKGIAHEVEEVASFGEDGLLESSELTIQAASQEEADRILSDLQEQFGESLKEGCVVGDKVVCVVEASKNEYNRDSYTHLLEERMTGFEVRIQ